jgi:hypothetical protein
MAFMKGKIARTAAATLSAGALVVAIAAPTTSFGQAITLRRSCTDTSCIANTNVGIPIAAQLSSQRASLDPSVSNRQSNDADQDSVNANHGIAAEVLAQSQSSRQSGGDQSNDLSNHQDQDARASVDTRGGDVAAIGPSAIVHFDLSQDSDASVTGDAVAVSHIGQAGGDASNRGDNEANGGDANGGGRAIGGDGNGNSLASSLAAQLRSGNADADTSAHAGDGGNSRASSGDADADGGRGGSGGDARTGGNGNGAVAADIAASINALIHGGRGADTASGGDTTAGDASNTSGSGDGTGGAGAAGGSGTATSGSSTSTGGAGGTADANTSSATGSATNTSGAATSTGGSNVGNANNDGRGGSADGGTAGHVAAGGNGTINGNTVTAALVGGTSANVLDVSFSQTGNPSATGGSTSNTGSATASPSQSATLNGNNSQTLTNNPSQTGTNGGVSQTQTATSDLAQTLSNDAQNRARAALTQNRNGDATATTGDQSNTP